MSNDSQLPENPSTRNPSDFSKDFVGFGEDNLWELDDNPIHPIEKAIESEKSYGVMESNVPSGYHGSSAAPAESIDNDSGILSNLTIIEKTSMTAIVVALMITAALANIHFNKDIPVGSEISEKVSLPVEGKILSVSAYETYWREPDTQGETPDIVRSGVKLIPTIKIQTSGNSGAIRVFFRDEEGTLVGDSTTLAISGDKSLTISATNGFTDLSMHTSYRTGNTPRWIIQILEGPAIDAPIEAFKTLFQTEISTDIR